MSYPTIDNNASSGHQNEKHPNVNFRLRTPTKQSGDVMRATEEQQKQNDMVSEYNQMCGDNNIKLLQQQNQTDSKILHTALSSSSQIVGKAQDVSNALKGSGQKIKQRTDSSLTQQQQKQQQEQQKTQQQQQF